MPDALSAVATQSPNYNAPEDESRSDAHEVLQIAPLRHDPPVRRDSAKLSADPGANPQLPGVSAGDKLHAGGPVGEFFFIQPPFVNSKTSHAIQEWEGYVLEVRDTDFTARLLDVTAAAKLDDEEAIIPRDQLSARDNGRIRVGSVFRWIIGYEHSLSGDRRRFSQIVLRDLPAVTSRDLQTAKAWADKMTALFAP